MNSSSSVGPVNRNPANSSVKVVATRRPIGAERLDSQGDVRSAGRRSNNGSQKSAVSSKLSQGLQRMLQNSSNNRDSAAARKITDILNKQEKRQDSVASASNVRASTPKSNDSRRNSAAKPVQMQN